MSNVVLRLELHDVRWRLARICSGAGCCCVLADRRIFLVSQIFSGKESCIYPHIDEDKIRLRFLSEESLSRLIQDLSRFPSVSSIFSDERRLEFVGFVWGRVKTDTNEYYILQVDGEWCKSCVQADENRPASGVNEQITVAMLSRIPLCF